MTLRMYADRKGWPLEAVDMRLRHHKVHAKDCEDLDGRVGWIDIIQRELRLEGPFDVNMQFRFGNAVNKRFHVFKNLPKGL